MKQTITTWYLSFLLSSLSFGQNSVNPVSPNAAAFGKYIDIPVGEATGIPLIQIPINEIDDPELKLSILLSYHAGGQRVNDIATHVGLGWSLNAGGQITRVVNGKPDDLTEGYWFQYQNIPNRTVNYITDFSLLSNIDNGAYDTEPDMFYYNFNGTSGKFFLDPNYPDDTKPRIGQTIPLSNLKIEYFAGKFTITTDAGIIYEFSVIETTTQAVGSNGNADPVSFTSNWLLSKISSPLCENSILFSYDDEINLIYPSILSQSLKNFVSQEGTVVAGTNPNFCANNSGMINTWSISSITQRRLSRITFSKGYFLLVKGDERTDLSGDYVLEFIRKYDNNDVLILEYKFQYIYKGNRLHLNKLYQGKPGNYLPPTEFVYNTMNLPSVNSFSQDHWGFYNTKVNTNLIPKNIVVKPYFDFADREPNEAGTRASNLEKIIYPTGGSTSFEYELNKYGYEPGNTAVSYSTGTPTTLNANVSTLAGESNTQTYSLNILFPQKIIVAMSLTFPPYSSATPNVNKSVTISSGTSNVQFIQVDANTREYNITSTGLYQIVVTVYSEHSEVAFHALISYQSGLIVQKFKNGPGLRVKKITKNDGAGNVFGKSFIYQMEGETDRASGMLLGNPAYLQHIKQYTSFWSSSNCLMQCYILCAYDLVNSETKTGLGKIDGSYIVYKEVVTKEFNLNDIELSNGYIRRFFATPVSSVMSGFPSVTSIFPNYLYGYLKKEQTFDNTELKKKELVFNYQADNECGSVISPGLKVARIIFGLNQLGATNPSSINLIFQFRQYHVTTKWFKLISKVESIYSNNATNQYITETNEYFYENLKHLLPTKKITTRSGGTVLMDLYQYPHDLHPENIANSNTNQDVVALKSLIGLNIINVPVESYTLKKIGDNFKVTKATLNKYKLINSRPLLANQYVLKINNPISIYQPCSLLTTGLDYHPDYYETTKFNSYSKYGAPNEIVERGKVKSTIHASLAPLVVASAENASNSDMGYCGFEDYECRNTGISTNFLSGNLSLIRNSANCNYIESTDYVSGSKGFVLGGTCAGSIQSAIPLNVDQTYKIQFWMKNGSTVTVYNGSTAQTNVQTLKSQNGWTLQEYTLTNCISFSISGSGIIDDVKYFPVGAFLKTWVYKPLIGIVSEENENNNRLYYEYDGFNRLNKILNEDKKTIKKFIYSLGEVQ